MARRRRRTNRGCAARSRRAKRRTAPRSWRRRLTALALRAVGLVVIVTALLVAPFRWIDPPTSAFMLREWITGVSSPERRWRDLDRISPELALAVVAAEDQKFPHHHGFDLQAIQTALTERRGAMRGASTITQQVAKNLYLWPGRSLVRKGLEAWLTAWIEASWPKRRILEIYLNTAEFGPGVFGAEVASTRFFGKPARALSRREASLLAAVLPNPKKMRAARPSEYVENRAAAIRRAGEQLGGPGMIRAL